MREHIQLRGLQFAATCCCLRDNERLGRSTLIPVLRDLSMLFLNPSALSLTSHMTVSSMSYLSSNSLKNVSRQFLLSVFGECFNPREQILVRRRCLSPLCQLLPSSLSISYSLTPTGTRTYTQSSSFSNARLADVHSVHSYRTFIGHPCLS